MTHRAEATKKKKEKDTNSALSKKYACTHMRAHFESLVLPHFRSVIHTLTAHGLCLCC
eukprot:m.167126 g.167126  ORF g.167126 m.167126 type:complete len:58 (-) comp17764_c1_seq4:1402-1575(-)